MPCLARQKARCWISESYKSYWLLGRRHVWSEVFDSFAGKRLPLFAVCAYSSFAGGRPVLLWPDGPRALCCGTSWTSKHFPTFIWTSWTFWHTWRRTYGSTSEACESRVTLEPQPLDLGRLDSRIRKLLTHAGSSCQGQHSQRDLHFNTMAVFLSCSCVGLQYSYILAH